MGRTLYVIGQPSCGELIDDIEWVAFVRGHRFLRRPIACSLTGSATISPAHVALVAALLLIAPSGFESVSVVNRFCVSCRVVNQ